MGRSAEITWAILAYPPVVAQSAIKRIGWPFNGQPILLMADCATTGGYAKIAQVISADLPILAQLRPGEKVRFEMTTLALAEHLLREREAQFERQRLAVASLFHP